MNSAAKFAQSNGAPKQPAAAQSINTTKEDEIIERVLTVDFKTMRTHIRNDSFNNPNTILEIFAKVYQKETVGKVTRLTLKNLDNTHAMGAIFYGNQHAVQTGDEVRCLGLLIQQTGQFKVLKLSKIDFVAQSTMINRLEAISGFEVAKLASQSNK